MALKQDYDEQMTLMKKAMEDQSSNKYSFNYMFAHYGCYDRTKFLLNVGCCPGNTEKIKHQDSILYAVELTSLGRIQNKSDFSAAALMRTLFTGYDSAENKVTPISVDIGPYKKDSEKNKDAKDTISLSQARVEILKRFKLYQFWPNEGNNWKFRGVTFWSENHMFLYLSNCYLYHQHQMLFPEGDMTNVSSDKEKIIEYLNTLDATRVLKTYLDGHNNEHFHGVYEVNAPSYVHYTSSALLNLYDFAIDGSIRESAKKVLDRIVYFLMLTTDTKNGVFSITACGRMYQDNIKKDCGFGISPLLRALNGGNTPDKGYTPSYFSNFLSTTTWKPNIEEVIAARDGTGTDQAVLVSHAADEAAFQQVYGDAIKELKCTPILWSAGYFFHPDYLSRTNRYFAHHGLSYSSFEVSMDNLHMSSLMSPAFQEGQYYTGFKLYVYKQPEKGLVLSSFQNYNVNNYSFQQMVWMANINRAPVYSVSINSLSRSLANVASTLGMGNLGNFNNCSNPEVCQKGDVMLLTYTKASREYKVKLMWPANLFDNTTQEDILPYHIDPVLLDVENHALQRRWLIGKRGDVFIGVSVMGWDGKLLEDKKASLVGRSTELCVTSHYAQLQFPAGKIAVVVLVGTKSDQCASLQAFRDERLLKVSLRFDTEKNVFHVTENGSRVLFHT